MELTNKCDKPMAIYVDVGGGDDHQKRLDEGKKWLARLEGILVEGWLNGVYCCNDHHSRGYGLCDEFKPAAKH